MIHPNQQPYQARLVQTLDWLFYAFVTLYAVAALTWLLVGFGPLLLWLLPSLREIFRTWAAAVASNVPELADFFWLTVNSSYQLLLPAALLQYLFSLVNLLLAGGLLWLRPRELVARLLAVGLFGTAAIFNLQAHRAGVIWPPIDSLHSPFHLISGFAYAYALLLFPDGHLVLNASYPVWLKQPLLLAQCVIMPLLGVALVNFNDGDPVVLVIFFGLYIPITGLIGQLLRAHQASTPAARQEARVLIWALALALALAALFAVLTLPNAIDPHPQLALVQQRAFLFFPPLFVFLPLALCALIVRYRVWQIDLIINRALVFGALTAALGAIYISVVVAIQVLVWGIAGAPTQPPILAVVVSTLLVAALFQPLRRRVQGFIDRRFYHERVELALAFDQLGHELRTVFAVPELLWLLTSRSADLLRSQAGAVFLADASGVLQRAAAYRVPIDASQTLAVDSEAASRLLAGEVLTSASGPFALLVGLPMPGAPAAQLHALLALGPRRSDDGYSRGDRRLLAVLAQQAGAALHIAHLLAAREHEAERLQLAERQLAEYRASPAGQAELLAVTLLANPATTLTTLYQLTQAAGHDSVAAGLLAHLPKALEAHDAQRLTPLAEGYHYLFRGQHAPELVLLGLRQIGLVLANPPAEWGDVGAVRSCYQYCEEAASVRSVAQIVALTDAAAPQPGTLLMALNAALAELGPIGAALQAAHSVETAHDQLSYLALAVERLSRLDRQASATLAGADRPILRRIVERWLTLVGDTIAELQNRANLRITLLTRQVPAQPQLTLRLQVHNTGRGLALAIRLHMAYTAQQPPIAIGIIEQLAPAAMQTLDVPLTRAVPAIGQLAVRFTCVYTDLLGSERLAQLDDMLKVLPAAAPFQLVPNPYVVGAPLRDGSPLFVGRSALVEAISATLMAPQRNNLVLIGQRRTGKTSLLKQLPSRLGAGVLPVYLDGQALGLDAGLPAFFLALATEISYALEDAGLAQGVPTLTDYSAAPAATFLRTFLPQVRQALGTRHLLLLLDEFEALESAVRRGSLPSSVFVFLRHLIQHTGGLSFVFCGTHRLEELAADYWSALFNISLYHHISALEQAEALCLIQQPVAAYGMRYDDLALEKIWRVTAGHPYFLQLLCHCLVARHNQQQHSDMTLEDVNAALEDLLAAGEAHFVYLWRESSQPEQLVLAVLSRRLPLGGQASTTEVQHWLAASGQMLPPAAVVAALQRLGLRDILQLAAGVGPGTMLVCGWKLGLVGLWVERRGIDGMTVHG